MAVYAARLFLSRQVVRVIRLPLLRWPLAEHAARSRDGWRSGERCRFRAVHGDGIPGEWSGIALPRSMPRRYVVLPRRIPRQHEFTPAISSTGMSAFGLA